MMARDDVFISWPEMTRAAILATAVKGVDGGARTTRLGGVGDLKQGAGLLNAYRAINNADHQYWAPPNGLPRQAGHYAKSYNFAADFTTDMFGSSLSNDTYAISAPFTGRLRAAIAWDASAAGCSSMNGAGCRGETLDGDLDLHLDLWTGTSWTQVCASTSWDSSWELCDVAVTSGQTYRIQLAKFSTSQPGTYVGVAWYMYDPAND
jgi:hypothetical protein